MAVWTHHVLLGDIWNAEDLSFTETRDAIVKRLALSLAAHPDFYGVDDILIDLSHAGSESEFDDYWHDFYDWADAHRVWVDLWKSPTP